MNSILCACPRCINFLSQIIFVITCSGCQSIWIFEEECIPFPHIVRMSVSTDSDFVRHEKHLGHFLHRTLYLWVRVRKRIRFHSSIGKVLLTLKSKTDWLLISAYHIIPESNHLTKLLNVSQILLFSTLGNV